MSRVVDDVMNQPPEERLGYAIEILRQLCADDVEIIRHYRVAFGMPPQEARVAHFLAQRADRVCSPETIFMACWPHLSNTQVKTIDVYICKLRARGFKIETRWGAGYEMSAEEASRVLPKPREPDHVFNRLPLKSREDQSVNHRVRRSDCWTEEDDAELLRMADNGSDVWYMAQEFGRTERAVIERLRVLRSRA